MHETTQEKRQCKEAKPEREESLNVMGGENMLGKTRVEADTHFSLQ